MKWRRKVQAPVVEILRLEPGDTLVVEFAEADFADDWIPLEQARAALEAESC